MQPSRNMNTLAYLFARVLRDELHNIQRDFSRVVCKDSDSHVLYTALESDCARLNEADTVCWHPDIWNLAQQSIRLYDAIDTDASISPMCQLWILPERHPQIDGCFLMGYLNYINEQVATLFAIYAPITDMDRDIKPSEITISLDVCCLRNEMPKHAKSFYAMYRFMNSEYVDVQTRDTMSKKARRAAIRSNTKQTGTIKTIVLRKQLSNQSPNSDTNGTRDYNCSFWVRGHWQGYHCKDKETGELRIEPRWKTERLAGNLDKPCLPQRETFIKVSR